MKRIVVKSILIVLLYATCSSCEKDSTNETEPITSLNATLISPTPSNTTSDDNITASTNPTSELAKEMDADISKIMSKMEEMVDILDDWKSIELMAQSIFEIDPTLAEPDEDNDIQNEESSDSDTPHIREKRGGKFLKKVKKIFKKALSCYISRKKRSIDLKPRKSPVFIDTSFHKKPLSN